MANISKIQPFGSSEQYDIAISQNGTSENAIYPILLKYTNDYNDENNTIKFSNNHNDAIEANKQVAVNPSTGELTAAKIKICYRNDDNGGIFPAASNWNSIGASNLYFYRSYITHYYGNYSHISNWDSNQNIGTAVTSNNAATKGKVNFYNNCAAGGTQTKTLLEANDETTNNITITLPKTTGLLALADGTNTSGTWPISITGSSTSCTGNAATANQIKTQNITEDDFNLGQLSGFYRVSKKESSNLPGTPTTGNVAIHAAWDNNGNTAGLDLLINDSITSNLYYRSRVGGGSLGNWKTLIDSNNYTDYTVKKDGTGASGTWGISISGNAVTASRLNITSTDNAIARFDGTNGTIQDSTVTIDDSGSVHVTTGDGIYFTGKDGLVAAFKLTSASTARDNIDMGWEWSSIGGAGAAFRSSASNGQFVFFARTKNSEGTAVYTQLIGTPEGSLTWGGRRVVTSTNSTAVGSSTLPIYIDANGYAQIITSYNGNAATADIAKQLAYQPQLTTLAAIDAFAHGDRFEIAKVSALDGHNGLAKNDGMIISIPWSSVYAHQFYVDDNGYSFAHRWTTQKTITNEDGTTSNVQNWQAWKYILDENNYTTYTVKKDGTGASGTWGISISGSANTLINQGQVTSANVTNGDAKIRAYLASSSMTTGKPPADVTENGNDSNSDAVMLDLPWDSTSWGGQLAINLRSGAIFSRSLVDGTYNNWKLNLNNYNYTEYAVKYEGNLTSLTSNSPVSNVKTYFTNNIKKQKVSIAYNSAGIEKTFIFSKGNTDNVGSILQWNYSDKYIRILRSPGSWATDDFEKISAGYADNAGTADKWTTARTLTIGSTGKSVDGSAAVSWSHAEIGATISNTWIAGTDTGPKISTTVNGVTGTAVAIPTASANASGIVTNTAQTFGGSKTFSNADSFIVYANQFILRNKAGNNDQASASMPYVNSILIGDGRYVTINEYRDDHVELHANSVLLSSGGSIGLYDNTKTYEINSLVWHEKKYYRCIVAITTAEDWNIEHWAEMPATGIMSRGNLIPYLNNSYDLGTSTYRWREIYGTLKGNADTATKLSNTPNNTNTFLRGDNTWSTALSGPFYVSNTNNNTAGLAIGIQAQSYNFGLHMGTGGENHGLYDFTASKWVVLGDASHTWTFKGKADSAIQADNSTTAVYTKQLAPYDTLTTLAEVDASSHGSNISFAKVNANILTTNGINAGDGLIITVPWSDGYWHQFFVDDNAYTLAHRYKNNTKTITNDDGTTSTVPAISDWKYILDTNNYTTYTVTKTGSGASGTWSISVTGSSGSCTGNANTATTATNATNIYSSASTSKAYVLGTTTASSANHGTVYNASVYTEGTVLYGAAWNDYAEYRKDNIEEKVQQQPGRCVREVGDGTLMLTTERLQRGCEIISDTFGFAIGQDLDNGYNTPVASSGRVLAYPYESIDEFKNHIGWPVCSGPDGTVSIMTEEEEEHYSSRIIGTISEVPDYEEWGADHVKVNGRIWIRIR